MTKEGQGVKVWGPFWDRKDAIGQEDPAFSDSRATQATESIAAKHQS
jgi:hypothetical protein